jgi:LPXTG-motif cell wall-anchored protein
VLCCFLLLCGLLPSMLLSTYADTTPNIYLDSRVITDVLQRRYEVKAGDTETLSVQGLGSVNWSCDNKDVVTVAAGTLRFTGKTGYARITAGNASCSLGVTYYISAQAKSPSNDDDPSYPDEGAIHLAKAATGVDFQTTAVAQVELNVQGVPLNRPKDIVIVVDCSSSMKGDRMRVAKESLKNLVTTLYANHPDGTPSGNRIALVGFNDYDAESLNDPNWSPSSGSLAYGQTVLSGGSTVTDAFVGAESQASLQSTVDALDQKIHVGTNYDLGMQTAYEILYQSRQNNREKAVIFMSDGAPFQFNYRRGRSSSTKWGTYISSTDLLWANAIKGTAGGSTTVTVPYASVLSDIVYGQDKEKAVPNLATKLYSIGFCLGSDQQITLENVQNVLKNISSGTDYCYFANDADSLSNVFSDIASSLSYAATGAVVTDTLGSHYRLVTSSTLSGTNPPIDLSNVAYLGGAPTVEVGRWSLNDAGERLTYKTVESFPLEGKNGDLTGNTFTFDAESGTFSWNIGTVLGNTEYVLRYPVQLTGALEGTREEGSYPTNSRATLSYVNYLGHQWAKDFPVPAMPWQAINVTCEYYLVNQNGQPINAQGAVVPLSQVEFYSTETKVIYYNSDNVFESAIPATELLPHGCRLYNPESAYYIHVGSGTNQSVACIRDTGNVQTTFLIQPGGVQYTSQTTNFGGGTYNLTATQVSDYTNTHIAFAVTTAPIEDEQLELPQTGGSAGWLCALAGVLVLMGGGILFTQRKQEKFS